MMLREVLELLKSILFLYGLLLSFSLFLSWIPNSNNIKIFRGIRICADVFLEPIRGWIVLGGIDFTPVMAISSYFYLINLL